GLVQEWIAAHPGMQVKFHEWWRSPRVWAQVQAIDPVASHASWMEAFPWTRLAGVAMPETQKPPVPYAEWTHLGPAAIRERLGDGNFAGRYLRSDADLATLWSGAVSDTREQLESGWAGRPLASARQPPREVLMRRCLNFLALAASLVPALALAQDVPAGIRGEMIESIRDAGGKIQELATAIPDGK